MTVFQGSPTTKHDQINHRVVISNYDSGCDVFVKRENSKLAIKKSIESVTDKKILKSPLRYPGGKTRATKTIMELIPKGVKSLVSPFTGGGSIELACASVRGMRVFGYDTFTPVVNFWQVLLKSPVDLADLVTKYFPLTRTQFYKLQRDYITIKSGLEAAAIFYVLNRASFSGTTLSGGMSLGHPRFTATGIERLRSFQVDKLSVEQADFKDSIAKHNNDFLYLDPPYANGGKLYGSQGDCHTYFNHEELATILKRRDAWLLSYNDCQLIRDLYSNYKMITPHWQYGMSKNKCSNELLIFSHDYRKIL